MSGHEAAHPSVADLFWPAANFSLFAGLAIYYLRGPVREYFRARGARLRGALEAGTRARAEAAELRDALAREREALPRERDRLRADLREAAEGERQSLIERGRRAATRIREDARLLAESELSAARRQLRDEVVAGALRHAASVVRASIEARDQERLVREFVESAGSPS